MKKIGVAFTILAFLIGCSGYNKIVKGDDYQQKFELANKLYDEKDFEYWRNKSGNNWMLQRIVGNDCSEFTVGIFGFGDGESISPIILKRRLSVAGNTIEAQVNNDEDLVEISKNRTEEVRRMWPFFRDRRIDAYGEIIKRYID